MILIFVLGKRFINFCSLCWPSVSGQHRTNVCKYAEMYVHISVSAFIGKLSVGVNGKILKLRIILQALGSSDFEWQLLVSVCF